MLLRRALVVSLLLVGAACGGSDDAPPATTSSTTTTSTSTTLPPIDPSSDPADPYDAVPVPPPGTPLTEGRHAVLVTAVAPGSLDVDVVEFLIGAEAERAAHEDGTEATDFYIRNADDEVRHVEVADDVSVQALLDEGPEPDPATFEDVQPGGGRLWFVDVADDEVTAIVEQYLP